MKEVKMDILGRVNIPKVMRDILDMQPDSKVFIEMIDDKVIITKNGNTQVCPVCNIVFSNEYAFCPYCGQHLATRPEQKESK